MRYDLESMLPINAFSPRGGRGPFSRGMTLEGGKGGGGSAPSPDPNIGLAQQRMAQIQQDYLTQFQSEIWPVMKAQAEKQDVRADEQWALDREIQQKQMDIADEQYKRYTDVYKPLQDTLIGQAKDYNTEGNFERQAGLAMGDVKDQFAQQREQQNMQMRSYGINPSSGRYQGANSVTGIMEAATSASAATKARAAAEQLGWAKSMDALALGSGVFGNQATSTGLALNAGSQALNAGQTTMGNYGAMSGASAQATGVANQGWGQIGQLGVQKYNADVNSYSATQQANATSSAGLGSALGAIGGAAMKYAPAMIAASDIRVKENIELVGQAANGLYIYEFEYKPEFKDAEFAGHGRFRGFMAHEVEALNPEAVFETSAGYKAVDYSKVN